MGWGGDYGDAVGGGQRALENFLAVLNLLTLIVEYSEPKWADAISQKSET
jgi:hypothetical protein